MQETGLFVDALAYAWRSLPEVLRRNGPAFIALVFGSTAMSVAQAPGFWTMLIFNGAIVGPAIFCLCARLFRKSLLPAGPLVFGMAVTSAIPNVLSGLIMRPEYRPHASMMLFAWGACVLVALWAQGKLSAAPAMLLLDNTRESPLDAIVASWHFVSGSMWWRFVGSSVVFYGLIDVIGIFAVNVAKAVHLSAINYPISAAGGVLAAALWSLAALRLTSASGHLRERYKTA